MKATRYSLGIALAMLVSTNAASAATLGAIEFDRITSSATNWTVDLGGVNAGIADHMVTYNDYNGAATLPGGLPANYSYHIDRTYFGDGNVTTADLIQEKYLFKLDPAAMGGATAAVGDATLTIVTGMDTGMWGITFKMFQSDQFGNQTGAFARIDNEGTVALSLDPSQLYTLQILGQLRRDNGNTAGDESTNVARYDIVLGLDGLSPVPVPPALLLLLSGLGALFGYGRMRGSQSA